MKDDTMKDLTLLGNQNVQYPTTYDNSVLETFDNSHPEMDFTI